MPRHYQRQTPFDHSSGRSPRVVDYVGVRLGVELRQRAIMAAEQLGIPLSEWVRLVVANALANGNAGMNGIGDPTNAGYLHGRSLGFALAQQQVANAVRAAIEGSPSSVEEATARGMLPPATY
jgi:hypothetical protein